MNTPAHLIFGMTAFGKADNNKVTTAAVFGAITPDLSLYLMVTWSIYVQKISPRQVFNEYYFSPEWQQVFAIDNSFVLWGLLFGFALWAKRPMMIAFAGAGFIHLCFDFPFHNDDARMHFWPLTDWVFVSPFSYWDRQYHAGVVGPAELTLSITMCVVLWRRYKTWVAKSLIAVLAGLEVLATGFFGWFL